MNKADLAAYIDEASRERGISCEMLRAVLRDFLKVLHEADFKSGYYPGTSGYMAQVYFALGPEAAFHLVEFMARDGRGRDPDDVRTELQYLDSRAYRFRTTVERWQAEVDSDLADRDGSTET